MRDENEPIGVEACEPGCWETFGWKIRAFLQRFLPRKPSNLELHAERELRIAGLFDEDSDYGGMMGKAVMRMVREFAKEGHSGFSAGMAIAVFQKVAGFEPLTPLTGGDNEWVEVGEHCGEGGSPIQVFQNRRCGHVFRQADRFGGQAYDIDGRVFREPGGACYTSRDSCVPIEFPYLPKREYVDVEEEAGT